MHKPKAVISIIHLRPLLDCPSVRNCQTVHCNGSYIYIIELHEIVFVLEVWVNFWFHIILSEGWHYMIYKKTHVQSVCKLNLPKYFEAISIARSGIPISRSAFTKVDHVGTSRFIQAVSISCLQVLVVWMSRRMVIRTDSGTLRHIPRRNQSLTPCSSLTRSFNLAPPTK